MNNNRIILSIVVLLAVASLCLVAVLAVTGGALFFSEGSLGGLFSTSTPAPIPPTPTEAAPFQIPTPIATPTPGEQAGASLPADVASQMDQIQDQVARIRGLNQPPTVQRELLTVDQLRQKVENDFFKDYNPQEVEDDVRVLSSFGLLEPGYDLYDLYLNLYTEQIAGFYDLDTTEMFVVLDQDFLGPQRSTYAHEYTHDLQDFNHQVRQNLNYNDTYCKTDSEYCAAIQALIEGDASLTEQSWLYLYATDQDRSEIDQYYQNVDLSVYDSAPPFLKEDFIFPYKQGVDFALALFENGGFANLDRAYSDPPVSTEQILHPDLYPADKPVRVDLPDLTSVLGRSLRELDQGVMGEWYTYLILSRGYQTGFQIPDSQAADAAAGWGGDAYAVYWDDAANLPVVVLYMVWDQTSDSREFAAAFQQYGTARWGAPAQSSASQTAWDSTEQGSVLFNHTDSAAIWVVAPSIADSQLLMQLLTAQPVPGSN